MRETVTTAAGTARTSLRPLTIVPAPRIRPPVIAETDPDLLLPGQVLEVPAAEVSR